MLLKQVWGCALRMSQQFVNGKHDSLKREPCKMLEAFQCKPSWDFILIILSEEELSKGIAYSASPQGSKQKKLSVS